jgi:hypothetical protein
MTASAAQLTEAAQRIAAPVLEPASAPDDRLPWKTFLELSAFAAWQNLLAGDVSAARTIACRPFALQYLRDDVRSEAADNRSICVSYLADAAWRLLVRDVYASPAQAVAAAQKSLKSASGFADRGGDHELAQLTRALEVSAPQLAATAQ